MKREENMKFFKQHSINIKNYTAHPHHLVHVPAKFRENTAMRFFSYSAKTKRDGRTDRRTDRQTDGRGALQYLPSPGLRRRREIIKKNSKMFLGF